jgi:prepilin-type N-terminal cleavage/methylation domain-containing protein
MKHFRKSGFTLVELLVVIGIIAVLIGILMPTLKRARQAAVQVTCASNLRQISLLYQIYTNDSKGWLPHPVVTAGITRRLARPIKAVGLSDWFRALPPSNL